MRLRRQETKSYNLRSGVLPCLADRSRVVMDSLTNPSDSRVTWEMDLGDICVMVTEMLTVGTPFLGWYPRLCN